MVYPLSWRASSMDMGPWPDISGSTRGDRLIECPLLDESGSRLSGLGAHLGRQRQYSAGNLG